MAGHAGIRVDERRLPGHARCIRVVERTRFEAPFLRRTVAGKHQVRPVLVERRQRVGLGLRPAPAVRGGIPRGDGIAHQADRRRPVGADAVAVEAPQPLFRIADRLVIHRARCAEPRVAVARHVVARPAVARVGVPSIGAAEDDLVRHGFSRFIGRHLAEIIRRLGGRPHRQARDHHVPSHVRRIVRLAVEGVAVRIPAAVEAGIV